MNDKKKKRGKKKKWLILALLLFVYPAYAFIPQLLDTISFEFASSEDSSKKAAPAETVSIAQLPESIDKPTLPIEVSTPKVEAPAPKPEPSEPTVPKIEPPAPAEEEALFPKVVPEMKTTDASKKKDALLSHLAKRYEETKSYKVVLEEAIREGKGPKEVINILLKLAKNQCTAIKEMTQAAYQADQVNMDILSEVISGALDADIGTDVVVACSMEGGAGPEEIIVVLRKLGLSDYADSLGADDYESPDFRDMPGENERVKGNVSPYKY